MDIARHISNLLYENDRVIIPGFGGLNGNYFPAKIHPVEHILNPPSKKISFNANLRTDDSLLINFITNEEKISVDDASGKISQFVGFINEKLESQGAINLPEIGNFYYDIEKQLQFAQYDHNNHLMDSFGLGSIQFSPIIRRESIPERKTATIVQFPTPPSVKEKEEKISSGSRLSTKRAMTAALPKTESAPADNTNEEKENKRLRILKKEKKNIEPITTASGTESVQKKRNTFFKLDGYTFIIIALTGLLIYQWVKYDIRLSDFRNLSLQDLKNDVILVSNDLINGAKEKIAENRKNIPLNEKDEINYATPITENNSTSNVAAEPEKEKTEEVVTPKNIDESKKTVIEKPAIELAKKSIEKPTYYIVVGSFKDIKLAEKLIGQLQNQSYIATIISNENGYFRVGIENSGTKEETDIQLSQVRSGINPGAWILKAQK